MKLYTLILTSSFLTLTLNGCSTIAKEQNENLTKTLPDGSILHYNTNVTPTADWGCTAVGTQSYNWDLIQTKAQFTFSGPYGLLVDNAVDYLTQNNLKANYVNIIIPESHTLSFSDSTDSTSSYNMNPDSQAVITLYNCKLINPDLKAGATEGTDIGIGVGAGASTINNAPMP